MSEIFHPLVSIVIPVYNGSNYMREAIDSALAQTYDNIEILVINDGSNDNGATDSIAKSYGDKIRYFQKENGGVATALNLGIEKMKGEFFSWLSHDDMYFPEKIELQINAVAQTGALFLYGGYDLIDAAGNYITTVLPAQVYPTLCTRFHLFRGLMNGCSLLIHRTIFQQYGTFDPQFRTTQDFHLWHNILKDIAPYYLHRPLCKTRVHSAQDSKTVSTSDSEGDSLWIEMISSLSDAECCVMSLSPYAFYSTSAKFLLQTPYTGAQKLCENLALKAEEKLESQIKATLVSVIIPFYNRLPLLLEAIESARSQSHKNIEIILIDDGSSEDISEIKSLCSQHKEIRLIQPGKVGRSAARNIGIVASKGEFIAFLDSDDLWLPNKVEHQLNEMLRCGICASHTSYIRFYERETKTQVMNSGLFSGNVYPSIIGGCIIATPTVMLHKTVANIKELFPQNIDIGEDIIAWLHVSVNSPWLGIDIPLTKVRCTSNSASIHQTTQLRGIANILHYTTNDKEHCKHTHELYRLCKDFLDNCGVENIGEKSESRYIRLKKYYIKHGFKETLIKIIEKILSKI